MERRLNNSLPTQYFAVENNIIFITFRFENLKKKLLEKLANTIKIDGIIKNLRSYLEIDHSFGDYSDFLMMLLMN